MYLLVKLRHYPFEDSTNADTENNIKYVPSLAMEQMYFTHNKF
jgi:hypothetical protein